MFEIARICQNAGGVLAHSKIFDMRKREVNPVRLDQRDRHSWTVCWHLSPGEYLEMRAVVGSGTKQIHYNILTVRTDGSEQIRMLDPVPVFA